MAVPRGQRVAHPTCLLLLIVLLLGFIGVASAQTLQPVPKLSAHVTDLTATLSADERGRLEAKLATVERERGAQIALLLVPTVQPEAIEQYALRVAEAWRLGRKGVDDGVLLLVAKEDRKLRIEVAYGLEGALNDATAKRIVSEIIAPRFKQGEFYGGIDAGLDAMIRVVGGEALPPPKSGQHGKRSGNNFDTLIFFGFVLVFVVGGVLRAIFGRFLAAGIIAVFAAVAASLIFSSLLFAIVIALVAFIASLFAGATGGGWPMGGGSWGGGGGGGGGGFSGGGGSFGGGGASGGW
jgi:uncharacterized protein